MQRVCLLLLVSLLGGGAGGGEKKKQPLFKKSLIFGLAGDLQAVAGLIKLFFNEAHEM